MFDNLSEELLYKILDRVYPVGSPYVNFTDERDPNLILGFGTWEQVDDVFLKAVAVGATPTSGGSATHSHGLSAAWAYVTGTSTKMQMRKKAVASWAATVSANLGFGGSSLTDTAAAELGGSTDTGSNVPPYEEAYVWKRVA